MEKDNPYPLRQVEHSLISVETYQNERCKAPAGPKSCDLVALRRRSVGVIWAATGR
jgi:hypothetical protein